MGNVNYLVGKGGWWGFLSRSVWAWRQKHHVSDSHVSYVTPAKFYSCSGERFSPEQGLFDVIFRFIIKKVQLQDAQTLNNLPS